MGLAGCPARQLPEPMLIDAAQDLRIQREVEARFAAEPSITAGQIRIEVQDRTVVLHGSVEGIGAWQCALRNASLIEGVERVADFLIIERGPRDVLCLAPRRL